LAALLTLVLLMYGLIEIGGVFLHVNRYGLGAAIEAGRNVLEEARASDQKESELALAYISFLLIGAVVWIRWQRRCHQNLLTFGEENLKFTISQGTRAWFIPFVNLLRPYRVTKDILERTSPGTHSTLLTLWWAAWIANGFVSNAVARLPIDNGNELMTASAGQIVSSLFGVGCSLLALGVVWQLTRAQQIRAASDR
jgi:hypothetical protein